MQLKYKRRYQVIAIQLDSLFLIYILFRIIMDKTVEWKIASKFDLAKVYKIIILANNPKTLTIKVLQANL